MKKYITLVESAAKPKEIVAEPVKPKTEPAPLVHISESYEPNPLVTKIVRKVMEKKNPQPPQPPKQRNPVAKNANAALGGGAAGKHKDKKKDAKQGVQKHKGQSLDENDDWGSLSKGEFKRRELEHELGHETRSGAVYIDGKYWKTFDTFRQAQNVARSLERKGKRATARMLESYGSPSPAQKRFNRALEKQRNSPENKADRESHRKRLDAIMPPPKKDTPVGEKMRTPFAGAAVGQKEGPAGQLKAMDPKGYPKGKLVGGALEEGKVCPQCGSSKCSCPPGKCKCKPVAGFKPKMKEDKDPCWDNYKMVGTKKKGGKTVPNCVPKESRVGEAQNAAQQAAIAIAKKKKKDVAEGGPFSYGKPPRKGSVADLAAKRRKEQDRKTPPIEPKDQMVGTAKVTKDTKEGFKQMLRKVDPTIKSRLRSKADRLDDEGDEVHQDLKSMGMEPHDAMTRNMDPEKYYRNADRYRRLTNKEEGVAEDIRTKSHFRQETDDALADFLARGGKTQEVPPNKVRVKSGQSLASKHIGSKREAGRVVGKDRKISGNKAVVSAEHMSETHLKEGGEKYKIKSTGSDVDKESGERRDYYISPSTGKKVYKTGVKKGDHESPNSGDVKKQVKEFKMSLPPAGLSPEEAAAFAADQQARSQAMYQKQQQQQTQQALPPGAIPGKDSIHPKQYKYDEKLDAWIPGPPLMPAMESRPNAFARAIMKEFGLK